MERIGERQEGEEKKIHMDGQDIRDKKWKRGAKRKHPQITQITQIRNEEEEEEPRMDANGRE